MSAALVGWSALVAQLLLAAAMGCALLRMFLGPRAQDRVLALAVAYFGVNLLAQSASLWGGLPML